MKHGCHSINPRLHIEAAAAVQNDDGSGIQPGSVYDQIVLKLRQAERAIVSLAIPLLISSNSKHHCVIAREACRRLQRRPASLQSRNGGEWEIEETNRPQVDCA